MSRLLFVTDLDHTLVGDDGALAELNHSLSEHRRKYGTKIVYATGRSLFLYQQLEKEQQLLEPDALVVAVGTEIYDQPGRVINHFWSSHLSTGWHRDKIQEIADEFSELVPQPATEQNPFKISYFLECNQAQSIISALKLNLNSQNIKAKIVYSSNQDLDILPLQADKGQAMQFLQKQWSILPENTIVCGDSGNDIALFSMGNERGIIVGNAKEELRNWHQENPKINRYFAQKYYASGILEGLEYYGVINDKYD